MIRTATLSLLSALLGLSELNGQATATAPTLPTAPTLKVPVIQRAVLANGVRLQVVSMRELPVVRARLVIDGGARLDAERPGLATFTANMLDEGAAGRDAFQLAAEVAYLGSTLSTGASWDVFTIALSGPKRTFAQALPLLADVVLRPTFASTEISRQRDLRIAQLLQLRDQPEAVASEVFNRVVFPAGHPYHQPINGDSASTVALDSAVVRQFWRRAADPRRATLIVTGDITLAEARTLAERSLGTWRAPAAGRRPAPGVPEAPRPGTHVVLVDKPGAAQSVISVGAPGVARTSPDYPAITLMNTILGGSFSARLNDILREQKGYTYGARSGYTWRPLPGPFVAGSSVRTDVTDSSLAIFFEEFKKLREEPVPQSEVDRAKAYLTLGALGDFETTGQVNAELANLILFGLPPSSIPAELAAIQQLGAADVQRAARLHLDPSHLTVVVVGDLQKIRPGIEALGLGPVEVRDVTGKEILK